MASDEHINAVHEIAVRTDRLVIDKTIRKRFTDHIARFCKMVEDYGQALQPYADKLEETKKQIDDGVLQYNVGDFMTDICPPPKNWVRIGYEDNAFINVDMGVIFRPAEPVNPLLWFGLFGNADIQRKPTEDEILVCEYVLLAIIHDEELYQPVDRPIFSDKYDGKWFQRDKFRKEVWQYYRYCMSDLFFSTTPQKILSQLMCAFEYVQVDSATTNPAETEQKVTPSKCRRIWTCVKRIPRWIYVLVIFLAALLTCIYFSWWLWTKFSA